MSRTTWGRPRTAARRAAAHLVSLTLLGAGLSVGVVASPAPAAAAELFRCDGGSVYVVQADGRVDRVQTATGALSGSPVVTGAQAGGDIGTVGALGIAKAGTAVDVAGSDLVELGAGSGGTPVEGAVDDPVGGAVDPTSGVFYYGSYEGSTLVLHGYDPSTDTAFGPSARVQVPDAPGREGDFAFDAAGQVYVVAASNTTATLYRASLDLPTSGSKSVSVEATTVGTSSASGAVTGLAFASDGSLYASTAHTLARLDPSTGELGAAKDLGADVAATDLGSCAVPAEPEKKSESPTPTPTPSPTPSPTPKPSAAPTARSKAAAAAPALSVTVSATPATTTRTDQQVTYAVVVRNSGDQALRNVVVAAVAPRLSALTCAPVAQGGSLAVGSSTTCTGTRTTDQAYLSTYGDRLAATARGISPDGITVTGTGNVRTTTTALPPKATDDSATVVNGTASVTLPGSSNDSPGEPGGPVIDRAAAFFPDGITTTGKSGSTEVGTFHGSWQALEDGTIRFLPTQKGTAYPGGFTESVRYTTVDTAGHRTTGKQTVTMRPGPVAQDDVATTTQGDPVELKPLANDSPGVNAAGQRAPFVVSSLRFPVDQPIGGNPVGDAQVAADGRSMSIPYKGTFTIVGDTIRFVPAPTFIYDFAISYTVSDGVLNRVRADVSFNVQYAEPKLVDGVSVTLYGSPVSLPVVEGATPGIPGHTLRFAGFVDAGHTFAGSTLTTPEGTWSYPDDAGRPSFRPAVGFSGVAHAGYAVDEVTADGTVLGTPYNFLGVWGGRYTGSLTVTVRKGPSARTVVLSTPHDVPRTVDPTTSATPRTREDGTPGRFEPTATVFPDVGQPAGSRVTDAGRTLVLAVGGQLGISASTGLITYTPSPGFVGYAGTVAYRLEDDMAVVDRPVGTVTGRLSARLEVLATGVVPVATDDDATTIPGAPVRLAGATDDDRGTTGAPLAVDLAVGGQPAGSTVGSGGQSLTVPDEGTWSVGTDGSVTFAPVSGFVDGTSPVTYRVRSSAGTATAHLSVTVVRGAAAEPSLITLPELNSSWVDPIADDVAGRNADGTLGTIDRASLTFPTTGQPAGALVSADGTGVSVPAQGGLPSFGASVYLKTGAAIVGAGRSSFRGTSPAIRYSVQAVTRDSTGKAVRSTISSTFRVRFTGRDPIATDDSATVGSGATATLAAATNDTASAPGTGVSGPELPADQLGDLPPGSTTGRHCYDPEEGCQYYNLFVRVPGEGYWETTYQGTVTFTPERGFVGTTTSVRYRIGDAQGTAEASLTVTVLPPGTVRPDVVSTPQGVPVTVDALSNDTPARAADGTVTAVDPDGYPFGSIAGQPKGSSVEDSSNFHTLVVPKEGRYRVEYGTGRITFTPLPTYRGWTSSVYFRLTGSPDRADDVVTRFQVHVDHVVPTADPDEATTTVGTALRVAVLDNDDPGTLAKPLVPSSVRLRSTPGLPSGSTVSDGGRLLTVAGRGTFAVAGDKSITFYALPGWTGTLPAVRYDVADVNGTRALSTVTVRVKS